MNEHLIDLYKIYNKELLELNDRYLQEKENIYLSMKEYIAIYEKEKYIKIKMGELERELADQFNEEHDNDR